jgi:heparanase
VNLPMEGERYTLSSPELQSEEVLLNGEPLALGENDDLPQLTGAATPAGELVLDPATITFVAVPTAGNPACS